MNNQVTPNPYRWEQVNIGLFYGRNPLRHELVDRLRAGDSFGITGGRRMGKSTLLRRVEEDLKLKGVEWKQRGLLVLPIYLDLLMLPHPITSDFIFNFILEKSRDYLRIFKIKWRRPRLFDTPLHPFAHALCEIIHGISDYRLQIVVIFDEVEVILKEDWGFSFFSNWRSFLNNEPVVSRHLSAVFAGASDMKYLARDIGSPLANILSSRDLALFEFNDAALLMNEPTNGNLPANFVERVFTETGGHPFLIQYIMKLVCDEDLSSAMQSLESAIKIFLAHEHDKFERWWDPLSIEAKQIYGLLLGYEEPMPLRLIVQNYSGIGVRPHLDALCHTGIVTFLAAEDAYVASGQMFATWFTRYGTVPKSLELIEKVDRVLKEMERQLRLFLSCHLEEKHGENWLESFIGSITIKTRDGEVSMLDAWRIKSKRKPGTLSAEEHLLYSELGDLFTIILKEWNNLKIIFRFGKDPTKDKYLFEERRDCLLEVRNALRHVREETIDSLTLIKAQVFCTEIIDRLSMNSSRNQSN